jgi:hypothetical protein
LTPQREPISPQWRTKRETVGERVMSAACSFLTFLSIQK